MGFLRIRAPFGPPAVVLAWRARQGQLLAVGDPVVALQIEGQVVEVGSPYDGLFESSGPSVGAAVAPGDALGRVAVSGPFEDWANGPDPRPSPDELGRWSAVSAPSPLWPGFEESLREWYVVPGDHLDATQPLGSLSRPQWNEDFYPAAPCVVRSRAVGIDHPLSPGLVLAWVEYLGQEDTA